MQTFGKQSEIGASAADLFAFHERAAHARHRVSPRAQRARRTTSPISRGPTAAPARSFAGGPAAITAAVRPGAGGTLDSVAGDWVAGLVALLLLAGALWHRR